MPPRRRRDLELAGRIFGAVGLAVSAVPIPGCGDRPERQWAGLCFPRCGGIVGWGGCRGSAAGAPLRPACHPDRTGRGPAGRGDRRTPGGVARGGHQPWQDDGRGALGCSGLGGSIRFPQCGECGGRGCLANEANDPTSAFPCRMGAPPGRELGISARCRSSRLRPPDPASCVRTISPGPPQGGQRAFEKGDYKERLWPT